MGFSEEWEEQYRRHHQMSIWPWSDLVSYVYRYTDIPKRSHVKVLELGCGSGANIPLFKALEADYYALDGSSTIITMLQQKFPIYKKNLRVGDFTKEIPFDETFDIVVDRSSLTTNTTEDIITALSLVKRHMSAGGVFLGLDWFSIKHDDYQLGEAVDGDCYTKWMGEVEGQFQGVGNIHFSDKEHLKELLSDFEILVLEEKTVHALVPKEHIFAAWNFVAKLK